MAKWDAVYFDDFRCLGGAIDLLRRWGLQRRALCGPDGKQSEGALSILGFSTGESAETPLASVACSVVQRQPGSVPPFRQTRMYTEGIEAVHCQQEHLGGEVHRYGVSCREVCGSVSRAGIFPFQSSLPRWDGMHNADCWRRYPADFGSSASDGFGTLQRACEAGRVGLFGIRCPRKACKTTYLCAHCGATETSLWRRIGESIVCNACGLYYRMHGIKRPVSLRKSFIRKRRRSQRKTEEYES